MGGMGRKVLQRHHKRNAGLGYGCTGRDTAALVPSHSGAVPVTSHCLAWELIARALHRDD
jgi:hypothetical protein